MGKVIQFPSNNRALEFSKREDLYKHVIELKKEQLHFIIEDVIEFINSRFMDDGCDIMTDETSSMRNLIGEAVAALGFKIWHIDHPLHGFANEHFSGKEETNTPEKKE